MLELQYGIRAVRIGALFGDCGPVIHLVQGISLHCTNVQCIATPLYPNDLTLVNNFELSQGQSHAMDQLSSFSLPPCYARVDKTLNVDQIWTCGGLK